MTLPDCCRCEAFRSHQTMRHVQVCPNNTGITIDDAVTQVGLEVIGRVFLHSNATGCQLHACFCFNWTIRMYFFVHVHINNTFQSQLLN